MDLAPAVDHSNKKLGKHARRHDSRTLQLARYMSALPVPPSSIDWLSKVHTWPMYLNDQIGDCTFAAVAHMIQAWSEYALGHDVKIAERSVLQGYERVGGYVPGRPDTDNGCNELDVLNYWRKIGVGGHRIAAFTSVNPKDVAMMKTGTAIFGGLYLGISLPKSAQRQAVWDVPKGGAFGDGAPNSWGGHAVPTGQYDAEGMTVVTWGGTIKMTWAFVAAYCEEAYAIVTKDFLAHGRSPSGFDLPTLLADLSQV